MTKRELYAKLNAVRDLDDAIAVVQIKIEKLESSASGMHAIRYDKDWVQSTPSDPIDKFIAELSKHTDRLNELRAQMAEAIDEVGSIIDLAEDRNERMVLYYRYVSGLSWASVARRMHLSERHVFRVHDAGIEKIFKKCQSMSVNVRE